MKYKKPFIYVRVAMAGLLLCLLLVVASPSVAHAATPVDCPDGTQKTMAPGQTYNEVCKGHMDSNTGNNTTTGGSNGSGTASGLTPSCPTSGTLTPQQQKQGCSVPATDPAADPNATCGQNFCDLVAKYVNPAIKILSAMVGILVTIALILGGIEYSTSAGDPQKAAKAKGRITKAVLALVAYIFLYAFLQFIIPGGIH